MQAHHPMSEVEAPTASTAAGNTINTTGVFKTPRPPLHAKANKTIRKMK